MGSLKYQEVFSVSQEYVKFLHVELSKNRINRLTLWDYKKFNPLNSDGQQFHHHQQNKQ
jgi:hypothetical protein